MNQPSLNEGAGVGGGGDIQSMRFRARVWKKRGLERDAACILWYSDRVPIWDVWVLETGGGSDVMIEVRNIVCALNFDSLIKNSFSKVIK